MSALLPELIYLLCGDTDLSADLKNQDVVDLHSEYGGKNHEVVYGRQSRPTLPLVDGLRGAEAEDVLEILHRQTRVDTHTGDVDSSGGPFSKNTSIPRVRSSRVKVSVSTVFRPNLDTLFVHMASISPLRQSSIIRIKPSLLAVPVPEIPASPYTPTKMMLSSAAHVFR